MRCPVEQDAPGLGILQHVRGRIFYPSFSCTWGQSDFPSNDIEGYSGYLTSTWRDGVLSDDIGQDGAVYSLRGYMLAWPLRAYVRLVPHIKSAYVEDECYENMDDRISEKSHTEQDGAERYESVNDHEHMENGNTARNAQPDVDTRLDKRINRSFDRHIVPILFGLWLFAFIDRANIGNARIDGLAEDLELSGTKFNIVLAVFYVPYICVDVPSNLVLKYFKAGYYLPGLLIGWGTTATFTGFVKSYGGLIASRFFLGLCEGGLLGGMIIYLAMFYRRQEIMKRIGYFYSAAPLSGAFGGLLATGLAQISTPGYNGWPFIFV